MTRPLSESDSWLLRRAEGADMADFGKAGIRTVHIDKAGGVIDLTAGQSVMCTLDARGGTPLFTFACTHRNLFTPQGPIEDRYQWIDFDDTGSSGPNGDVHVLTLQFSAGATRYRFRMEVFDVDFALVKTLKDIEYETTNPNDFTVEPILLGVK
jgi:hypothetical protein